MGYKSGSTISPVYKKLLAAALVAYIVASAYWLGNLVDRVGEIEHHLKEHHD